MSGPKGPRDGGSAADGDAHQGEDAAPDTRSEASTDTGRNPSKRPARSPSKRPAGSPSKRPTRSPTGGPTRSPGKEDEGITASRPDDPARGATSRAAPRTAPGQAPQATENPHERRPIAAFLVGIIAGLLTLGLVWGATALVTGGDGSEVAASTPTATVTIGSSPSSDRTTQAGASRLARCREANVELAEPLRAAAPAMSQWEVHIGAMNKLVVGAITLHQANQFWNQTRVGAQRKLARFYTAAQVVHRRDGCPSPRRIGATSTGSVALRSCAELVAREHRALAAAGAAMDTWKTHVRHMEMLRTGEMSPSRATRLWLASWRHGVDELHRYRAAQRAVDHSGSC